MIYKNLKRSFLSLAVLAISSQSFAWGTKGHETIETVAVQLMPNSSLSQLLKKNIDAVKFLSMTPDLAWKHGAVPHPLEGQAHFFQIDFYVPRGGALNPDINFYIDRAGDPATILKMGTAPWRMEQMAALLVNTLRKPNVTPQEIIQIAATFGHYVGDLGNPLHVSTDFDGAGIGQKGLHSFFETETVNEMPTDKLLADVARAAAQLLPSIPNQVHPINAAFTLATAAAVQADVVLANAKKLGQTPQLKTQFQPVIVKTLAMSSAVLAKIWNLAYMAAGSPQLDTSNLGKVAIPDWVPVNYIKGVRPQ